MTEIRIGLTEFCEQASFVRQTKAGERESHPGST